MYMERDPSHNVCSRSLHLSARALLSLLLVASIQGSSHKSANFTINSTQKVLNKSSSHDEHIDELLLHTENTGHILPQKKPLEHKHSTNGVLHNDGKLKDKQGHRRSSVLKYGISLLLHKHSNEKADKSLPHSRESRAQHGMTTGDGKTMSLFKSLSPSKHSRRNFKSFKRRLRRRLHLLNKTKHVTTTRRENPGIKREVAVAGFSSQEIASSQKTDDLKRKRLYGNKELLDLKPPLLNQKLKKTSFVVANSKGTKSLRSGAGFRKERRGKHKRHNRLSRRNLVSEKYSTKSSKKLRVKDGSKKSARPTGAGLSVKEGSSGQNSERLLHRYKRKLDLDASPLSSHHSSKRHKKAKQKARRQIGYVNNNVPLGWGAKYWPVRELYGHAPKVTAVQGKPSQNLRGLVARPRFQSKKTQMHAFYGYTPREHVYRKLDPWLLANERHIFPVSQPSLWQATSVLNSAQVFRSVPSQLVRPRTTVVEPRDQISHLQGTGRSYAGFTWQPQTSRPAYGGLRTAATSRERYVQTPSSKFTTQTANPVTRQGILEKVQMAPKFFEQMHNTQNKVPLRYKGPYPHRLGWGRSHITQAPLSQDSAAEMSVIHGGPSNTGSCDVPVGLKSGTVTDSQLSSSSDFSKYHNAARGRLDATPSRDGLAGSWCASHDRMDKSQFLQVNLGRPKPICRVATQGQPDFSNWVTSYKLAYSDDGNVWTNYKENGADKVFIGNYDRDNTVVHDLHQPIRAQYVRFQPQSWHFYDICLRVEMYTRPDSELLSDSEGNRHGLLVYLNFDQKNIAKAGKRTDVSNIPGTCGNVARLTNGSEILLDGDKMRVMPREAVTMTAWIRLDSNKGRHSIFDTVGSHSQHQNGQYHFEVENSNLRWFHRNEAGETVFNATTENPLIPAAVWTHVAGVYDSRVGLAKIYINGRLRGVATGNGSLSQDWSAHAGIGQHKGKRFLQGQVDEFRIYNQALTQDQIQKLVQLCNFAQDCGGLFQSPAGLFESPEWPSNYRGKHKCTWRLITEPGHTIALQFSNFSLEMDGTCARARLVVHDGATDARVLGTYCGQQSPASVESSGNKMWVQFSSDVGATGKGFRLSFSTSSNATKKETVPLGQARRCSVTKPRYNVTLVGGIHSGVFSEVPNMHDMSSCVRHCCLRQSCHLSFMIRTSCYLVDCFNAELCKTKKARSSSLLPQISYVEHIKEPSVAPDVTSIQNPDTKTLATVNSEPPMSPQCHHTAVSYNVTLIGGISAGKFSTYGVTPNMDECIHHCCHDDNCDVAFMIQGNCYTVECEDREACQLKRAKPSAYLPTVAFVYRGKQTPIGDALPGALTPSTAACQGQSVSDTFYNVTLRGGIKSGRFTDKGVVQDMSECSDHCCADDTCNAAFLIRENCFLVACKDYDSCHVKPALSEYYHPRLVYVNWSPPDQEIPTNQWYASLGCWKDADNMAVPSLEGSDALLADSFYSRLRPTDKCAQVARKHAYRVFAIQKGGACQGGPKAGRTFNQLGESSACKDGKGGLFANSVYLLLDNGTYHTLGCWRSSADPLMAPLELSDTHLMDLYETRSDPVRKCAEVAKNRGFGIFAIRDGGMCFAGPGAEKTYKKYGLSRSCRDGTGGAHANSVYKIIAKNSLQKPAEAQVDSKTQESVTITGGAQSNKTGMKEDFVTLQDGQPQLTSYTAEPVLHNVTLKYGIKSGKFLDKGHVINMSECIKACGREESCRVAFMLGRQCFSIACHSDATCQTKPAFSVFYQPQIAFIKHKNSGSSITKVQNGVCRASGVHENVTLIGGIHAGKFHDLGPADDMSSCIQRCCQRDECEVAFMLEEECYGVTCASRGMCQTRRARNPERYHPRIAYIYRGKMANQALTTQRPLPSGCWDGGILYNQTLVGGINAGVFNDNGKADSMNKCMQFCCSMPRCDLAFMIEDDCYSVSCPEKEKCEARQARPTHYYPRIAFTKKFKAPLGKAAPSSPHTGAIVPEPHQVNALANAPVKVEHSCNASPIKNNKTLKMGLHSGVFRKIGKVDSMDDCIEMSCKQPHSDVAFMLGSMCYSVRCYSDELCQTVPVFGDNLAGFNLKPAISFLRTKARIPAGDLDIAVETEGVTRDVHCRESTITYNVTLRGGISSGNFSERLNAQTMRECIGYCCDDVTCDLAFMFGTRCYSVACENDKLCQAVLAKPSSLEPRISYVSRGLVQSRSQVIVLSENDDSSTCREDEVKHSKIFSNKSLAGGLESGSFKFLGKFRTMELCMRRCCASTTCDVAYMVDKNCFSVKCYSSALCRISDVSTTNGDVEISTILKSSPSTAQKHSMVVYVVIGVIAFMSGAGGIVWAVCMFLKRHRLKMRNIMKNQE